MSKHLILIAAASLAIGLPQARAQELHPGQLWADTAGEHINAHGGGVLATPQGWYWYGEHKCDTTTRATVGVTCYRSDNLVDWTPVSVALPVSTAQGHDLESGCVIERPKVIYNELTGKYVMWFHLELKGRGYGEARCAVAVADNPQGPFTYLRSGRVLPCVWPEDTDLEWQRAAQATDRLVSGDCWAGAWTDSWRSDVRGGMFNARDHRNGQMSRDMTLYVDDDGKAYHIFSSEENLTLVVAELSDDYTSHTGRYIRVAPGEQNEAPVVMKHGGRYWMVTSGCTGWDPNEARLYSADTMWGPWQRHPNPCTGPGADKTFGGQGTHAFRDSAGNWIFMADIWRPKLPSDSRYIWLPVQWDGDGKPEIAWADSWSPAD